MSGTESSTARRGLGVIASIAAIAAGFWMVVLQRIVTVPTDVEDALNA